MKDKTPILSQFLLFDEEGVGCFSVDVERFAEFDLDVTRSLETLVDRWIEFSAPQASSDRGVSWR